MDRVDPMGALLPLVSVVTVTRSREQSLLRCAASVASQDYAGPIEHVIVVDDNTLSQDVVSALERLRGRVRIAQVRTAAAQGEFQPFYTVSRIGYLRNCAIDLCQGKYIAYLDDDNVFLPNHIASLVELLEAPNAPDIAYSWRLLLRADGEPYLEPRYPWAPRARLATDDDIFARHIHEELLRTGIRMAGDPVQRDALFDSDGSPVFTIDTSELLVRAQVHTRQRWVTRFTWREMAGDYSDDYAFVKRCHEAGFRFACSEKPTLEYYLSGVSNRPSSRASNAPLAEAMGASFERFHGRRSESPECIRTLAASDGGSYVLFRTASRHEYNKRCHQEPVIGPCALCHELSDGLVFLDRLLIVPDPVPFAAHHHLLRFVRPRTRSDEHALFENRHVGAQDQVHRAHLLSSDVTSCLRLAQATGDLICFSMQGSGASFPPHIHAHAFRPDVPGGLRLPLLGPDIVGPSRGRSDVRLSRTGSAAFGTLLQGDSHRLADGLARTVERLGIPVNFVAGCGAPFADTWLLAFWRRRESPSHPLFRDEGTGDWRFGFSEMLGLFEVKSLRQLHDLTPQLIETAMREVTVGEPGLQAHIEASLLC